MNRVTIHTGASYEVLIGGGLLSALGDRLKEVHAPCRVGVLCDQNVAPLYLNKARGALEAAGFTVSAFVFPAGEEEKNLATYARALSFFIDAGLTRGDMMLALGGGVTGDLTGFAAATYQRGIPFAQAPTTLLAAVDASVGGKTAVDLPEGKNLVGAFHQPLLVLLDTDVFKTLPETRIADGAAEMLKHGLIADKALFERMKAGAWREDTAELVARNVDIKRSFVERDERDKGIRQLLNFGHTLGHAVERLSGFTLSHGQAVAIGMYMETRASRKLGFGFVNEAEIKRALQANGLPFSCPYATLAVLDCAMRDKKREGGHVTVGYLKAVGEGALKTLTLPEFAAYVAAAED